MDLDIDEQFSVGNQPRYPVAVDECGSAKADVGNTAAKAAAYYPVVGSDVSLKFNDTCREGAGKEGQ
jgi:hypothetical protein